MSYAQSTAHLTYIACLDESHYSTYTYVVEVCEVSAAPLSFEAAHTQHIQHSSTSPSITSQLIYRGFRVDCTISPSLVIYMWTCKGLRHLL